MSATHVHKMMNSVTQQRFLYVTSLESTIVLNNPLSLEIDMKNFSKNSGKSIGPKALLDIFEQFYTAQSITKFKLSFSPKRLSRLLLRVKFNKLLWLNKLQTLMISVFRLSLAQKKMLWKVVEVNHATLSVLNMDFFCKRSSINPSLSKSVTLSRLKIIHVAAVSARDLFCLRYYQKYLNLETVDCYNRTFFCYVRDEAALYSFVAYAIKAQFRYFCVHLLKFVKNIRKRAYLEKINAIR